MISIEDMKNSLDDILIMFQLMGGKLTVYDNELHIKIYDTIIVIKEYKKYVDDRYVIFKIGDFPPQRFNTIEEVRKYLLEMI